VTVQETGACDVDRVNCYRGDDEHHLIARYVETLSSADNTQV